MFFRVCFDAQQLSRMIRIGKVFLYEVADVKFM